MKLKYVKFPEKETGRIIYLNPYMVERVYMAPDGDGTKIAMKSATIEVSIRDPETVCMKLEDHTDGSI